MEYNSKIPVTIITGFLGAGKTTFINQLLQIYPNTKFALVENEFGEIAIDTKLVKGLNASQMFELKEGCICCTITDEYELTLLELAKRFPDVEHLLIETTGIADPTSVISPFFRDINLAASFKFNGTVCLVDSLNFENQPDQEISIKQIALADFILINKSESCSGSEIEKLKTKIRQLNLFCEIESSEYGKSSGFRLDSIDAHQKYFPEFSANKNLHSHITTKKLEFSEPLNKEKFSEWISYTLDIYKKEIYRVKGILCFENEPFEFILQGVGGSFELIEGDLIMGKGTGKLVFIGKLANIQFGLPQ